MTQYNPDIHHRRSIRLKGYDYSQQGAYFITICVQDKYCLFGNVLQGKMILNDAGSMIERWYWELEQKFSAIQCGPQVVMPNHFHAIIQIVGVNLCVRPPENVGANLCVRPTPIGQTRRSAPTNTNTNADIPQIVQWFKTMTTNEYIRNVKNNHWSPFNGKLWQRNYYEHIIRNEQSFNEIAEYIVNNPMKWAEDQLYVAS
jgi:putative transposase